MTHDIEVHINGRQLVAIPQESDPSGYFEVMERDKSQGLIALNDDTWENDDRGDLTYEEWDAVAAAIRSKQK